MIDNSWVTSNENRIFSIIKAKTMAKLKVKYPKIKYTTNDENIEPVTVFPTVYIAEVSSIPTYNTLERDMVEEVLSTFTVRVTVNTQKTDATKIATEIMNNFVSLGFDVVASPITTSQANMFVANARYRRRICYDDTI